MYQYCNKRKRIIKVENENHDVLDHQNNFSQNQKIPLSFDFSRNTIIGPGYSAKPFKKCILCDAELSSEKTVSDHVKGKRHRKKMEKRERDIKYEIISADDVVPEVIIEVPVCEPNDIYLLRLRDNHVRGALGVLLTPPRVVATVLRIDE